VSKGLSSIRRCR